MGVITGRLGELRVYYERAALLREWELTFSQDTIGKISVSVLVTKFELNDYWITKKSFDAYFWLGLSWWLWKNVEIVSLGSVLELKTEGNPEARQTL